MSNISISKWKILQDYYTLCKPKVIFLMLLTSWIAMILASNYNLNWQICSLATVGIGLSAAAAAVINHLVDRHIDTKMQRTLHRPIASGRIKPIHAFIFACCLGMLGLTLLFFWVNPLSAYLTFLTLIGYAVFYTLFLKRATPQNIVIGGAAGATPPLLGWVAVSNDIHAYALLLTLIIFTWTPPHFWALAIYRHKEYAHAQIPMLPVTHGIPFTKLCIVLYTLLLWAVSLLPFATGMSGILYAVLATLLGGIFFIYALVLFQTKSPIFALKTFSFSIMYLMLLFMILLLDHWVPVFQNWAS